MFENFSVRPRLRRGRWYTRAPYAFFRAPFAGFPRRACAACCPWSEFRRMVRRYVSPWRPARSNKVADKCNDGNGGKGNKVWKPDSIPTVTIRHENLRITEVTGGLGSGRTPLHGQGNCGNLGCATRFSRPIQDVARPWIPHA
jgi:hypothetical protein